jgi:hypothetical protein
LPLESSPKMSTRSSSHNIKIFFLCSMSERGHIIAKNA